MEHWDNARRQGGAAARNMLGHDEPYERVPYFYSDQFELSMEYAGFPSTWDRVVFRGDVAGRAFIAFWLRDGRPVAGMNVNVHKVNATISKLVAAGAVVDAARLADARRAPGGAPARLNAPGQLPKIAGSLSPGW